MLRYLKKKEGTSKQSFSGEYALLLDVVQQKPRKTFLEGTVQTFLMNFFAAKVAG